MCYSFGVEGNSRSSYMDPRTKVLNEDEETVEVIEVIEHADDYSDLDDFDEIVDLEEYIL